MSKITPEAVKAALRKRRLIVMAKAARLRVIQRNSFAAYRATEGQSHE